MTDPAAALVAAEVFALVVEPQSAPAVLVAAGEQGPAGVAGPAGPAHEPEASPVFTYVAGRVSRIDYAGGAYKLFTYAAGTLTQLDAIKDGVTTRKVFTYNPDGSLAAIAQTALP